MNTQKNRTQKLYEDATYLHMIHNGRKIRRDHFDRYWQDLDLIE
jgi:hypothetical protein